MVAILMIAIFALAAVASASTECTDDICITDVELDDDTLSEVSSNQVRSLEKGDEFEVKVHLFTNVNVTNFEIEAEIKGEEHGSIGDATEVFDLKAGRSYIKKLTLVLDEDMDPDEYFLRVRAEGRTSDTVQKNYDLEVESARHKVKIDDIIFSPENRVMAGRALLTSVRVENIGQKDEDGVKIKVSIPELGISASDFIEELDAEGGDDDEQTSEELYMRIPDCAEAGLYTVNVEVTFDDGDETISKTASIEVVDGDQCTGSPSTPSIPGTKPSEKTIIAIGAQSQDVAVGQSAVYPVTIVNSGSSTKTYTISAEGADFAEVKITPSNVLIVRGGDSATAYITLTAKNVAAKAYGFSITVSADSETLKQIPLSANVVAGSSSMDAASLRRALEIGLVILVVILVIIGLIIGFNRLRGSESDKEESQTYY